MLIGQMFIPSAGFQERELLACGKVVLSSMHYDYPDHQLENSPIVDVNPLTLENTLRELIPDQQKRQQLADRARDFQEKHHSPTAFCQNILDLWSGEMSTSPIIPSFFRQDLVPENADEAQVYSQFNDMVREESWYNATVPSGIRAGIKY